MLPLLLLLVGFQALKMKKNALAQDCNISNCKV